MAEETARHVGPAMVDLAFERIGHPLDPTVLLLMSGGAQLASWPDGFCAELLVRDLQVVRFDSRDSGRSTHFGELPGSTPNEPAPTEPGTAALGTAALGTAMDEAEFVPYTLSDMADDAVGLLDALGLADAHLLGTSLGAMIAQTVAIEHPTRVRTLTSMMSTTGAPTVGQPHAAVVGGIGGPPADRAGFIDWQVRAMQVVGSPGYPFDERAVTERAARVFDRGHDPAGVVRQSIAALASGDRTEQLRTLRLPTLVIHGADDPLFDVSGARATAAAIPGAELAVYPGMGHNLPRELWPAFADRIAALIARASTATSAH